MIAPSANGVVTVANTRNKRKPKRPIRLTSPPPSSESANIPLIKAPAAQGSSISNRMPFLSQKSRLSFCPDRGESPEEPFNQIHSVLLSVAPVTGHCPSRREVGSETARSMLPWLARERRALLGGIRISHGIFAVAIALDAHYLRLG
jgi:hypothetical protein